MRELGEQSFGQRAFRAIAVGGAASALSLAAACGTETPQEQVTTNADMPSTTLLAPDVVGGTLPITPGTAEVTQPSEAPGTSQAPGTTAPESRPIYPETAITNDGVGNIYIGQSRDELLAAGYQLEMGCGEDTFGVEGAAADVGVTFDQANKVGQISIYGLGVKTDRGIEIGSRQEVIVDAYGTKPNTPSTSILEGTHGTVNFLQVENEDATIHFQMTSKDGGVRATTITLTAPGEDVSFSCE